LILVNFSSSRIEMKLEKGKILLQTGSVEFSAGTINLGEYSGTILKIK
jgi:hypothetical protein